MARRTLTLKKESLTELTNDDLGHVVGGGSGLSCFGCDSDFQQCLTGLGCLSVGSC